MHRWLKQGYCSSYAYQALPHKSTMWCTEGRVRKHSAICPDLHRPLGYSLSWDPYTGRSAGLNPPDLWLFIEFKLALLELRPLAVTLLSRKWRLTIWANVLCLHTAKQVSRKVPCHIYAMDR